MGSGSIIHGMEHGQHQTGHDIDPQDMMNMGGLAKRMPITFWTFLIGGLALAGFPFVTAGFWSKDEIMADAFAHGHWVVFVTLLAAAFLTAFYTMRQIALTFLGRPRTESAENAKESPWTMTFPLGLLAFFALVAGFVGVHPDFPVLGNLLGSNPFEHFLLGSLPYHIEGFDFEWMPVILSVMAALGGLGLGWLIYVRRPVAASDPDPLISPLGPIHTLLLRKYFLDDLYHYVLVRPSKWISERLMYRWMDQGLIDGLLHAIGFAAMRIGAGARLFDTWGINYPPDRLGDGVKLTGRSLRVIQTGRIQNYLVASLAATVALVGAILYYLIRLR